MSGINRPGTSWCLLSIVLAGVTVVGCHRTQWSPYAKEQADSIGIDYYQTATAARYDDQALRRFFQVVLAVDGAVAETYAGDVSKMLQMVGEKRFMRVLGSVPGKVESEVLSQIGYDQGYYSDAPEEQWKAFQKAYPSVAALIETQESDE